MLASDQCPVRNGCERVFRRYHLEDKTIMTEKRNIPASEQIQAEIDRRVAEQARKKWAKHDRRIGILAYPPYLKLIWVNPVQPGQQSMQAEMTEKR
jgi:hypothetical protein